MAEHEANLLKSSHKQMERVLGLRVCDFCLNPVLHMNMQKSWVTNIYIYYIVYMLSILP